LPSIPALSRALIASHQERAAHPFKEAVFIFLTSQFNLFLFIYF
jgi:hypothetical protein